MENKGRGDYGRGQSRSEFLSSREHKNRVGGRKEWGSEQDTERETVETEEHEWQYPRDKGEKRKGYRRREVEHGGCSSRVTNALRDGEMSVLRRACGRHAVGSHGRFKRKDGVRLTDTFQCLKGNRDGELRSRLAAYEKPAAGVEKEEGKRNEEVKMIAQQASIRSGSKREDDATVKDTHSSHTSVKKIKYSRIDWEVGSEVPPCRDVLTVSDMLPSPPCSLTRIPSLSSSLSTLDIIWSCSPTDEVCSKPTMEAFPVEGVACKTLLAIERSVWAQDTSPESQPPSLQSPGKQWRRARAPSEEGEQSRYVHVWKELGKLDDGRGYQEEVQRLALDSEGEEEPLANVSLQCRARNMLENCKSVQDFEILNWINEGTYGVVFRARNKKTGEIVALKKVKIHNEEEGFPITSLREINILFSVHHPSIIDLKAVGVGGIPENIFLVMEHMEHDVKSLLDSMEQPFRTDEVKCLMLQLLQGTQHLHHNFVLHRDLKTSNLLLNNRGELKICDFGLSRQYSRPTKAYTPDVVTLWYRAPELLLAAEKYSTEIDMWSLGCIMAELLSKEPLFPGSTEIDQLKTIFKLLGTPNDRTWPGYSSLPGANLVRFMPQPCKLRERYPPMSFTGAPTLSSAGFDLLSRLLTYDPSKRITAAAALDHAWFKEFPLPKAKGSMRRLPPRKELHR